MNLVGNLCWYIVLFVFEGNYFVFINPNEDKMKKLRAKHFSATTLWQFLHLFYAL